MNDTMDGPVKATFPLGAVRRIGCMKGLSDLPY